MATITAFIRTTKKKADKVNIRFRLRDGRNMQLFHKSEIEVNPAVWDSGKQEIKAKVIFDADEKEQITIKVTNRKSLIRKIYNDTTIKEGLTSEWLDVEIDKRLHPEKYYTPDRQQTFFEIFEEFLSKHKLSDVRKRNFRVIGRALQRYQLWERKISGRPFELNLNTLTSETLWDIERFLRDEHQLCVKYPEIYSTFPESRTPQPRGQNTINDIFTKFRTFCLWAVSAGKTSK